MKIKDIAFSAWTSMIKVLTVVSISIATILAVAVCVPFALLAGLFEKH